MAATRPYLLVFKGEKHIIEAPGAAHAVQHVVGADISELRPARAAEVTAWVRGGNAIPLAGEKPAAAAAVVSTAGVAAEASASDLVPDVDRPLWDVEDARTWLDDTWNAMDKPKSATRDWAAAMHAFDRVKLHKRMTLEEFDIIRTAVPAFAEALSYAAAGPAPTDVEQIRASLEENPMTLDDMVEAIGEAKRRDLYIADLPPAEDAPVE